MDSDAMELAMDSDKEPAIYTVLYTSPAEVDLAYVIDSIESSDKSETNKHKALSKVLSAIESLNFMPNRYKIFEKCTKYGELRSAVADCFTVIYQVNDGTKEVLIYCILLATSDIERIMDRPSDYGSPWV